MVPRTTCQEDRVPTANITAQWVERLKPPLAGQIDYFDEKLGGFGVRVGVSGARSWFVHFRRAGETRKQRLTIGQYPTLTLAEARDRAAEILLRAKRGEDLVGERKAEKGSPTFEGVAREYLDRHAAKKRTAEEQRRILERHVIQAWSSKKAKDVSRADVIRLVEAIADRGAPVMANRTLNLIGRVFRWGMRRGLVEANPAALVEAPGEERERDRVLADDEIRAVWLAASDDAGQVGHLIKLALLTGQRRGELERMRWADLDLQSRWWTIPAEFTKNRQAHRVPLSATVLAILRAVQAAADGREWESEWVFPSRIGRGRAPIANIQKRVEAVRKAAGDGDWHFHDFRRTAATRLGLLGVPRFVIGKVLNHTSLTESGLARVTAVYDRYEYDAEKREALDRWAGALAAILQGKPAKIRELRVERAGAATLKGAAR